jgi:hypothetical protein
VVLFLGAPAFAAQDDSQFKYQTVTTKEGLSFRIPEDMPIETRNGIQIPIPFDEYMYSKFKQMDNRLNAMDAKLEAIQKFLAEMREEDRKRVHASQ